MSDATPISITLEFTPNPLTLKFLVNYQFVPRGAVNFTDVTKAEHSPLAQRLFAIPGIDAVMLGTNFVTITKSPKGEWDVIAEEVPKTIELYLRSGQPVLNPGWQPEAAHVASGEAALVEAKIREVLDNEIRPAVAMDGGDITFSKFEDGVVYLHLQGSCSSCPSSVATLKMGVETRLKDAVPSIKEVVAV